MPSKPAPMTSIVSKCDDALVIRLPEEAAKQLGWDSGDHLAFAIEGGTLILVRTKTKHDWAMEAARAAMAKYHETFEALAKS